MDFLHHKNITTYQWYTSWSRNLPSWNCDVTLFNLITNIHSRHKILSTQNLWLHITSITCECTLSDLFLNSISQLIVHSAGSRRRGCVISSYSLQISLISGYVLINCHDHCYHGVSCHLDCHLSQVSGRGCHWSVYRISVPWSENPEGGSPWRI